MKTALPAPPPVAPRFPPLQKALLGWFAIHRRPLPWREHYSPYATWIAEVMMQQTQMERGVEYYLRWMDRFPHVQAVAIADEQTLLKAWEGLGYYRRARNIQAAAQMIMREHGGVFPTEYNAIAALPGIGPYTAGAIMSTAYNAPVPCVDGNVERVLSRVFNIDTPVKIEPAKSRIYRLAQALIPEGQARRFNQALMELGALVCRKKPRCEACPLAETPDFGQTLCESLRLGISLERPVPGHATIITPVKAVTGVLQHNGKVFIQRRPNQGIWAGLWEFPGGKAEPDESPEAAIVREWHEELEYDVKVQHKITVIKHGYTTYRLTLHCFALTLSRRPQPTSDTKPVPEQASSTLPAPILHAATAWAWVAIKDLHRYPMPAPHRKLADLLE